MLKFFGNIVLAAVIAIAAFVVCAGFLVASGIVSDWLDATQSSAALADRLSKTDASRWTRVKNGKGFLLRRHHIMLWCSFPYFGSLTPEDIGMAPAERWKLYKLCGRLDRQLAPLPKFDPAANMLKNIDRGP